jgi:ABC-2 type transport system ATP-binding protein
LYQGRLRRAEMAEQKPVIVAQGLRKSFGKVQALQGLSLTVRRGEIVVLLGPNGAGKTTLVRTLTTLLRPDEGTAHVAGFDVVKDGDKLRRIIGLAGQATAVDDHLTGRENIELVARLYHFPKKDAKERAQRMLAKVDLLEAADRATKGYSGGMRRRLDLAASLIGDPQVIFLDEPTTGLDPPSRLTLWSMIDELRRAGTTILLTTQNLEEADRLADRIAVVDKGTIIAEGTSRELKARVGGDVVEIALSDPSKAAPTAKSLRFKGIQVDEARGRITIPATQGAQTLAKVIAAIDPKTLAGADVALRHPTLDDVFLALTGHAAEDKPATEAKA